MRRPIFCRREILSAPYQLTLPWMPLCFPRSMCGGTGCEGAVGCVRALGSALFSYNVTAPTRDVEDAGRQREVSSHRQASSALHSGSILVGRDKAPGGIAGEGWPFA